MKKLTTSKCFAFSVANLRFRVEKENNVLCLDLYQLIILPLLSLFCK